MPVTFPLVAADWFARLPISTMKLDPAEHVVADMTGRGEWISDDVAPMLWQGEVTLGRMTRPEADHARAMMDLIRPAGRLFWAFDIRRPTPVSDPTGAILGAAIPVISGLAAGNRELALSGLPAGYTLRRGDYLGFAYGGGRRALHRVANEVVVANSAGATPLFEVTTLLLAGVQLGTSVQLIRPAIPVMRVPGSADGGITRRTTTEGMKFQFGQTLAVIP
jgi:hypothetical protein